MFHSQYNPDFFVAEYYGFPKHYLGVLGPRLYKAEKMYRYGNRNFVNLFTFKST
jgi:hypothetical protein